MFGNPPKRLPQRVGFLLLPRFSLMAFSSAAEPLRVANWLSGRQLYEWTLLSADGGPVEGSNGMQIVADASIAETDHLPMVVVCASFDPQDLATGNVRAWLRQQSTHGADMGGLDTGSYVLARARLLEGYGATIHWEHLESFAEEFPAVRVMHDIFTVDRNRFTCSGGTAALDMMLHLIRSQHGHELAAAVSDEFIYSRIRESTDPQRMSLSGRLGTANATLLAVIQVMNDNLEEGLSTAAFAAAVGVSERQLERIFRTGLNTTPGAYYRSLKMERARALLRQTHLPVFEVAVRCGFNSAAHFSRTYRARFRRSPSADRRYIK